MRGERFEQVLLGVRVSRIEVKGSLEIFHCSREALVIGVAKNKRSNVIE